MYPSTILMINNHTTYNVFPNLNLQLAPPLLLGTPEIGTSLGSATSGPNSIGSSSAHADQPITSPLEPITLLEGPIPTKFEGLAVSLQTVAHQVQPHAGDILGEVRHILMDLRDLIALSSTIYDDLGATELGDRVKAAIDTWIAGCTRTLLWAHQELDGLVYRRISSLGRLYHRIFRPRWDKWEPKKIASIRKAMSLEAKFFTEWLLCLRMFCWAKHLITKPQSQFDWGALNCFWKNRFRMVKDIHVERITVVEPLQGEHLTIPLRFIDSFEDVHMVILLASQGTVGSPYIEGRKYEIDDSETNQAITTENFRASFEDGKEFEVTVLLRTRHKQAGTCPRCQSQYQGESKGGQMISWQVDS
ncbi:hypothetical protein BKA70DRAFT_1291234 [Coprinopsis sp. MPI-PUGE-AT-0042]|nr:hypothetical protein BKA70DRAFT_1291234 [Coprinopsis sp. MPI-PUGE-AT-0042]